MSKKHPEWAIKCKQPGSELRLINGRYYLYAVSSKWDPEKKRAKKITGKILGRITKEHGFIESRKNLSIKKNIAVKEYGANYLINNIMKQYSIMLQKYFPEQYQQIISAALSRTLHQAPIKNMSFHHENSFTSENFSDISMSPKVMTTLLKELGQKRDVIKSFFKEFISDGENVLMDVTHLHNKSKQLSLSKIGYNSKLDFVPQINLMMIFSATHKMPLYYRVLPGNIRDVNAFNICLKESNIKNAILIADKGFYSKNNIEQLDATKLKYILPIRRDNKLIDYKCIKAPSKESMQGYFKYKNKYIWYTTAYSAGKKIILFLDDKLKMKEEQDYLDRIATNPEECSFDQFKEKNIRFGTFAIITNLQHKTPEQIYCSYKSRIYVETMANTLKNVLDADRSYMRDEDSIEGWMFINYIALLWHYHLYNLLLQKELLSKYSPKDIFLHFAEIKKINIDGSWHLAEINSATKKLAVKLGMHIT